MSPFDKRALLARLGPHWTRIRRRGVFDDVATFCLFVGHGRSGGTLVGWLLNAHPNIVLTNELHALEWIDRGLSRQQLFNLIYYLNRRLVDKGATGGGGYTYRVPGQWQGRHRELRVIGDRKAGATAAWIADDPRALDRLRSCIGDTARIRWVNVARDPFDAIATTFNKTTRGSDSAQAHLNREIDLYFRRCDSVARVAGEFGDDGFCRIHHEDMVVETRRELTRLCGFLGLDAPRDYLDDCAAIVEPEPRRTREGVDWPAGSRERILEGIARYPWLDRYANVQK